MQKEALDAALAAAGGTQHGLASAVGCTQQSVSNWVKDGKVSRFFVIAVEAATGVSRHDLRPDLYPPVAPAEQAA